MGFLIFLFLEPEDPDADPVTYNGRWKKIKWSPLSRAQELGEKRIADLIKKVKMFPIKK